MVEERISRAGNGKKIFSNNGNVAKHKARILLSNDRLILPTTRESCETATPNSVGKLARQLKFAYAGFSLGPAPLASNQCRRASP